MPRKKKTERPPYSKYKDNYWMDEFMDYLSCNNVSISPAPNLKKSYTKKTNALYRCGACKRVWQSIWNRQIEYLLHFKNLPVTEKDCFYCNYKKEKKKNEPSN